MNEGEINWLKNYNNIALSSIGNNGLKF